MATQALIIVDVQNDFCPGGSLAVTDGNQVVAPLNKLADYAQSKGWLIIASRDWHPAVTSHFKEYGGIWPPHCVQNTPGAQFHPELRVPAIIVSKATRKDEDAYSAFSPTGAVDDDGRTLEEYLQDHGVKEVYVGGLATDYCVKQTALDALQAEFITFLLTDASRAVNLQSEDGDRAIQEMLSTGVIITTTDRVMQS